MPSTRATFNDEDLVPDEISLAMSHGGGSTVSRTSSILTSGGDPDNDEIVELLRGQCLVIFKPGVKAREVVCAGKYDKCLRKDHKSLQRDERNRGKPGWFRAVFTQKGRLMGGWLDSRMSAGEAKLVLEARKIANRKSAGVLSGSRGGGTPSLSKASPDSASAWDDCRVNPDDPAGGACIALGKQMLAESKPSTLKDVTEEIVQKQHSLQDGKENKADISVGNEVLFKRGRDLKRATVKEVYPDPLGSYYLLVDDRNTEIQVEEHMVVRVLNSDRTEKKLAPSAKIDIEKPSNAAGDPMTTIMETLQQTLTLMQQKEADHKAELAKIHATVHALQTGAQTSNTSSPMPKESRSEVWFAIAKGGPNAEDIGVFTFADAQKKLRGSIQPVWRRVQSISEGWEFIADYQEQHLLTVTLPPKPTVAPSVSIHTSQAKSGDKWYAVAKGRDADSTGIYTSWAKASAEVEGVSNACFKSFGTEAEAERFLMEYQEQRAEVSSLQAALSGMKMGSGPNEVLETAKETVDVNVGSLTGMGGRVSGPDSSQKTEGKIFGLTYTEETTLRLGLVPHPRSLAPQVQMHLMGQALDVSPLPYSVASSTADSSDSGAALSRALAMMAGAQTDMELGGEPMDLNWKSGSKISVASIKTLTQLRERLSELRQGKRAVEQTLLGRISSVLQHAGYDATVADEWAVGSILYRMGCDSQYYYIQLHEHILGQAWEDESSCDFENAKLEIEHHASELRRRRTMFSSRIMMICAVYAYLQDQSANNFRSTKLQEKRQKLAMLAMKKQIAQVESTYQKMKDLSAKTGDGGNGNPNGRKNDKNKPMCWKCHQAGIHTGGKDHCTWKNLTDDEAKAKALEWVAAKQAQIGGNNK